MKQIFISQEHRHYFSSRVLPPYLLMMFFKEVYSLRDVAFPIADLNETKI